MLNIDMNANLYIYIYNGNIKIEYLNINVLSILMKLVGTLEKCSIIQISLNAVRVSEYFCNY